MYINNSTIQIEFNIEFKKTIHVDQSKADAPMMYEGDALAFQGVFETESERHIRLQGRVRERHAAPSSLCSTALNLTKSSQNFFYHTINYQSNSGLEIKIYTQYQV